MSRIKPCPACRIPVSLPANPSANSNLHCPDCDAIVEGARPVVRPVAVEDEPTSKRCTRKNREKLAEKRRKNHHRSKREVESPPFWKTRGGRILSGVGLILLGVVVIGIGFVLETGKPLKGIGLGILCILLGVGSAASGASGSDEDADDGADSEAGDF